MRLLRNCLVPAVVLGLALASATAAGAAGSAPGARDALTPAAYRAKATALCLQAKARIAGLPKSTAARPKEVAAALNRSLDALQPLFPQFKRLAPPAALRAAHDSTVKGLGDGLALGKQIARTIASGADLQKAIAKVQAPFLAALAAIQGGFKQLGLTRCESVLGAAIGGS